MEDLSVGDEGESGAMPGKRCVDVLPKRILHLV